MEDDQPNMQPFIRRVLSRCKTRCLPKLIQIGFDDRLRLKHFSFAALVFFTSYGMIFHANKNLEPSLQQELTALLSLVVCVISLMWAVALQVLYILKNTGILQR